MIRNLLPGLILMGLGAFMVLGPVYLPRSSFGELGHGDGMGLIGMMLFGLIIGGAGLIGLIVGVALHNSRRRYDGEED